VRPRRPRERLEYGYAGGMADRFKTEALEHSGEQGGMLEAIAAAAGDDQFGLEPLQVKPHGPAQQDIEILKGDVSYVGVEGFGERRIGAEGGSMPIHSVQIRGQIEGVRHRLLHRAGLS
jgi:hypothetical protein